MRKIIAITLMLLVVGIQTAGAITASQIRWGQDVTSGMASNTLKQWTISMESRMGLLPIQIGTGNTYYVDSNVSVEGDGKSFTNARNALNDIVASLTANNGDVVYVAQGHNEGWTAADSAALTVAGVTIIGCGTGTDMPRFDYDGANAELVLGAENIHLINLAFYPSTNQTVHAIEIEADADGSVIEGCWFMNGETSGTDEFIDAVQPAALADNITIVGCRFDSYGGAGANTAVDMTAGVLSDWKIWGNYFNGDYAEAPIYSDNDVHLRAWIEGNVCQNTNSGEFGIEFGGAATGVIIGNRVYTDALTTAIDPGSCSCIENYAINTIDLSAARIPANTLDAIVTDLAGISQVGDKVQADMDANSTDLNTLVTDSDAQDTEAEWADLGSTVVDNIVAAIDANSTKVGSMTINQIEDNIVDAIDANSTLVGAGSIADEVVAHMDANSSDLTAIATDSDAQDSEAEWANLGSTLVDNIIAAIDANSTKVGSRTLGAVADEVVTHADANSTQLAAIVADTGAQDTEGEWADLGSSLVDNIVSAGDANSTVLYWQERTVYTTADEVTEDLFTVAGGPILITSMVGYVDVLIGAGATTCKLWIDTTAGASYDQDFSTAVNIETDAVGTTYVFTAVNPSVLTPLTPGSAGATQFAKAWFCPVGTVEQLMSADPGGAGGDHITWYMTYKPLKTGVTVAGVSP